MNKEIEQLCARLAAAWNIDIDDIGLELNNVGESYLCNMANERLGYEHIRGDISVRGEDFWAIVCHHRPISYWLLSRLRLPENKDLSSIIYRFYFWMGADVQFLEDAGITVRAHDKLEWALQMREKGFTLNANG